MTDKGETSRVVSPIPARGSSENIPLWMFVSLGIVFVLVIGPDFGSALYLELAGRTVLSSLQPKEALWLPPDISNEAAFNLGMYHLGTALRLRPQSALGLRLLARGKLARGDNEAARLLLEEAVELRPGDLFLLLDLGDVCNDMGLAQEAVTAYESGGLGYRSEPLASNYVRLAEASLTVGSRNKALKLVSRALEVEPLNLCAHYLRYKLMRDAMADQRLLAELIDPLVDYDLESLRPGLRDDCLGTTMVALLHDGIWDEASFETAIATQVNITAFVRGMRGIALERELLSILGNADVDQDTVWFYLDKFCQHREAIGEIEGTVSCTRQSSRSAKSGGG